MKRVNKVIVSPCKEGFAITKFGDGKLTVQPTYHHDWTRGDIRKSLAILYPNAHVVFYNNPIEIVIKTAFSHAWQTVKTINE